MAGDTAPFPAPATVLFTGPPGSQLDDTGGAELGQLASNVEEYRSPWITSPPTAPAGAWTEEYKGNYYDYTEVDPQASSRLVVPVPTFQANGSLSRVDWQYRAGNGTPLTGPPAFMRSIRLLVLDPCGVTLHDSLPLDPATLSRTLNPSVTLTQVAQVIFQYVDDMDNPYTVRYGTAAPGNCKMVEFSAPTYSAAENVSPASITVRRVGDLTGTVMVNFTTSNGTAQQGQDYTNASQLVTLGPNVSSQVIGVPILDNGTPQGTRTVLLGLNSPGGGATLGPLNTAVLTINDDDPRVRFSSATYTVSEGSSTASITVQRTGATAPVVSVPYSTSDGSALAGADYTATSGVLTFTSGQTSKTFTVPDRQRHPRGGRSDGHSGARYPNRRAARYAEHGRLDDHRRRHRRHDGVRRGELQRGGGWRLGDHHRGSNGRDGQRGHRALRDEQRHGSRWHGLRRAVRHAHVWRQRDEQDLHGAGPREPGIRKQVGEAHTVEPVARSRPGSAKHRDALDRGWQLELGTDVRM